MEPLDKVDKINVYDSFIKLKKKLYHMVFLI